MTKIFIEVVNNSAFSKEKNKFVIRKSDENIEDWCNRIIQTFVSKNINTLTINAFYPINPFVKCYYLTKSFSMKTAISIASLTGLNINQYSSFKSKNQPNLNLIDCIFVIGSKPGFLSEDAIELAKNLNINLEKDKKIIFCGNEDLLLHLDHEKKSIKIDYPLNYFEKENLLILTYKFTSIFFTLFDNHFKSIILKNKLLKQINVKINSTQSLLNKNIKNSKLHINFNENDCRIYIIDNEKLALIRVLPFLKLKNNKEFIFNWFKNFDYKSKILEIIFPKAEDNIFLNILEKKISKKVLIWLNICCLLDIMKENLHNIISLKIYNLEYINNKIFKNLLNLIDENN